MNSTINGYDCVKQTKGKVYNPIECIITENEGKKTQNQKGGIFHPQRYVTVAILSENYHLCLPICKHYDKGSIKQTKGKNILLLFYCIKKRYDKPKQTKVTTIC